MVSNRKLDVAESGLLESIPPVCRSSKGSHLERAVLPGFAVSAVFCVAEMLQLCTAVGFCCPSTGLLMASPLTCSTKLHVTA